MSDIDELNRPRRKQREPGESDAERCFYLGKQKYPLSRFVKYTGRNGGERLLVFLQNPKEVVTLDGRENVVLAVQEINDARKPYHPAGFWIDPFGEPEFDD